MNEQFHIDRKLWDDLFPFHMVIDHSCCVVNAGRSCLKLFPDIIGTSFNDQFMMVRPKLEEPQFEELAGLNELIVFRSHRNTDLTMRGKFSYLEKEQTLLFTGTPWFRNTDEIRENNLTLNDFSVSDPMIDLLHVLKTEEIVTREVTELLEQVKKQQQNSETAAEQLEELITNLQTGILLEDQNRKVILTNKNFCEMVGIPAKPEELIGMDCSNSAELTKHLFKNPEAFVRRITELVSQKQQASSEIIELANGRIYERDYIPLYTNDSHKGHLWQYMDVTEKMKQQELLRKSEEKYRGIITNINLGLIEVDLEEIVRYANKSFYEMSGYSEEELLGKKTFDVFHLETNQRKIIDEIRVKRNQGISNVYEINVTVKNGENRWWAISGAPLYDSNGNIIGSLGIHLDITNQKILEKELREAKNEAERSAEAKESFLANMSHEIRTPLSGIYGMMQLLNNTRMNKEQESYVHSINKAILNLQAIVNDILDLSKINAGMLHIEEVYFSMQEELSSLFHLLSAKARENGLKMTLEVDPSVAPFYKGDPHRIRQVLNNLIGNALKFTEKGEIAIRCTFEKAEKKIHWLKIEIKDSGIGIEDEFLDMIFDKFTQEEKGHARKFGGTGLGMSISKQLVELMNGKISVESKKFKGTTVNISLPLKIAANKPLKINIGKRRGKLVNNRILIAEDNEINARVITSMLEQEGAKTFLVKNGKELIDKIKSSHFDIVISDLQMPLMGGIEAAKWIRKNIQTNIRLVALTANAFSKEKKRCFAAGFDEVLFKPFRKEDLLNACLLTEKEVPAMAHEEIPALPERLYHLEELNEMIDHDTAQLKLLVGQFIKETPGKIKKLEKAFQDRDQKEIKQMAHYLLSSVQHMGITSTYETIRELDQQKFIRSPKRMEQAIRFVARTLRETVAQLKKDMRNGIK